MRKGEHDTYSMQARVSDRYLVRTSRKGLLDHFEYSYLSFCWEAHIRLSQNSCSWARSDQYNPSWNISLKIVAVSILLL